MIDARLSELIHEAEELERKRQAAGDVVGANEVHDRAARLQRALYTGDQHDVADAEAMLRIEMASGDVTA